MHVEQDVPAVRWGMGDAVLGIVASLILSNVFVVLAFEVGDYEVIEDLPLWLTALLQVPLWVGLAGAAHLATTRKGRDSHRADFGLAMRWRDVPVGLGAGFVAQWGIYLLTVPVYKVLGVDTDRIGESAERLTDRAVGGVDVIVLLLFVVIGAPIVEELFYRGLVLRSVEHRFGTTAAVLATSLVFALLHFQLFDLLPLVFAGLLFGVLAVRAGRLGPAIWAHVAFNLTAVVALLASG